MKKNAVAPGSVDLLSDREALSECKCGIADLLLECMGSFAVAVFCSLSQAACLVIIGLCSSTYHSHRKKLERKRDRHNREEDLRIRDLMKEIVQELGYTPGKGGFRLRVSIKLGKPVSERRCGRLMREFGFVSTVKVRKDPYMGKAVHDHPFLSPFNLVKGRFRVGPRCVIATDITYIYYGRSGKKVCYLCIYLDCFTLEALGWSVSSTIDTSLVLEAYEMMKREHGRELKPGFTIIHSDAGSQYMAGDYRDQLLLDNFRQSCSRRGTPTDNAEIECFNGLFKATGLLNVERARTLEDVRTMCGNWMKQSNATPRERLAGLTPDQYYVYASTGVYPADSYLGIIAGQLNDPEEFLARQQAAAERSREHRRNAYHRKHDIHKAAADPLARDTALVWMLERAARDLFRVNKLAGKLGKAIAAYEKTEKQALRVKDWIEQKAIPYIQTLKEELAEELRNDPRKWMEHAELRYIAEMNMLF